MLRCRTNRDSDGKSIIVSLRWFEATSTNLYYLREMQYRYPNQTVEIVVDGMRGPIFIPVHTLDFDHKSIRELNPSIT